jgi:hypothetical protein
LIEIGEDTLKSCPTEVCCYLFVRLTCKSVLFYVAHYLLYGANLLVVTGTVDGVYSHSATASTAQNYYTYYCSSKTTHRSPLWVEDCWNYQKKLPHLLVLPPLSSVEGSLYCRREVVEESYRLWVSLWGLDKQTNPLGKALSSHSSPVHPLLLLLLR